MEASFVSDPKLDGMVPFKLLFMSPMPVSFVSDPKLDGMVPVKLLVRKYMEVMSAPARVEKGPAALSPSRNVGSLGKVLPRSARDFVEAAAVAGAYTAMDAGTKSIKAQLTPSRQGALEVVAVGLAAGTKIPRAC
jgi:hypothetical protein